jgi:hypothetical protein
MRLSHILPCKFSSNIYVHRQLLSTYLTNYSSFRLNLASEVCTPDDIQILDNHLIKAHYKFIEIIKSISILENDSFVFGS